MNSHKFRSQWGGHRQDYQSCGFNHEPMAQPGGCTARSSKQKAHVEIPTQLYLRQICTNKKPKRQYDLKNLGKHVAHIAYSFPHLFALHALPHLQHMQVSFLATVKAPRDIYIFIGPQTGIGYEAGKFSVVCFCMRKVMTFRAKHAKHG